MTVILLMELIHICMACNVLIYSLLLFAERRWLIGMIVSSSHADGASRQC